jgi:hypothetical protein
MVIAGPGSPLIDERSGNVGALLLPESKLGRFTTVLPPRTSTPGAAGIPFGALPEPPGPGVGEIPDRALESEPCAEPVFPAPVASPVRPLPEPGPLPMLEPPPEPPIPGLSPPEGDNASDPFPPFPGRPAFDPGFADRTTAEFSPAPAEVFGGAATEPISPGPPLPKPLLPEPEAPVPDPTDGGGGTTLLAGKAPPPDVPRPLKFWPEPEPEPELLGGGGTTFPAASEG